MYHKPNSYCSYLHQLSYRTGSHDVYRQLELTKPHLSDLFSPSCRIHPMAITVSWDINFWESLRYREVALDNLIYYLKYLYLKYGNTYIYIHSYLLSCFNHFENNESQWEGLSYILWNIQHVRCNPDVAPRLTQVATKIKLMLLPQCTYCS